MGDGTEDGRSLRYPRAVRGDTSTHVAPLGALWFDGREVLELEVGEGSPAAGRRVQDVPLPDGSLIISVLRDGAGFVPKADSMIEAGDQVLLILDPGLEQAITPQFAPNGASPNG